MQDTMETTVLEGDLLLAALRSRRSVSRVSEQEPPEELIRAILEAATWAPNHHLTEPWRFFVFRGDARAKLGEVMGQAAADREIDPERAESARASMARKPLRAPYVIAVAVEPESDDPIVQLEDLAATSAAMQNMLLAAEAVGLGAIWRSGWAAYCAQVREMLGLSERATMLGFVYVGYATVPALHKARRSVDACTRWMDAD